MLRMVWYAEMQHVKELSSLYDEISSDRSRRVHSDLKEKLEKAELALCRQLQRDFGGLFFKKSLWEIPDSEPISPLSVTLLNRFAIVLGQVRTSTYRSR